MTRINYDSTLLSEDRERETLNSLYYNMDEYNIPKYMQHSLARYILHGTGVGSFLIAILTNDLKGAVGRADEENQKVIVGYVKFLYNHAPLGAWGSEDSVESWMKRKGIVGILMSDKEKEKEHGTN